MSLTLEQVRRVAHLARIEVSDAEAETTLGHLNGIFTLIETMQAQGVDSFAALAAATIQGSTETTFYVLAVYFGAVGIQKARHAVPCALLAELAGVVAAILVCYWFFA